MTILFTVDAMKSTFPCLPYEIVHTLSHFYCLAQSISKWPSKAAVNACNHGSSASDT